MHTGQTALLCKCFPYTPDESITGLRSLPILPDSRFAGASRRYALSRAGTG